MKTQKYIVTGLLVAILVVVGTLMFQQSNKKSEENLAFETEGIEKNISSSSNEIESDKGLSEQTVTAKGKISLSFQD